MEMKQYLIDTFKFNDLTNTKLLAKIKALPDQQQCIRFFSHLINSQNKWMARVTQYPQNPKMDWWEPVYALDELANEWGKSLQAWIEFIGSKSEDELFAEAKFIGYDGGHWACKLKDIALQLNYHSIHHRAQMQLFIRQQGLEPDFVDYIGTAYKKLTLRNHHDDNP
jgi:uncharacterized damage-inducible protein DinB